MKNININIKVDVVPSYSPIYFQSELQTKNSNVSYSMNMSAFLFRIIGL